MKIEIDIETKDKIVLDVLKDDYINVKQNIHNIKLNMKQNHHVADHVMEDYKYNKKLLKAIKRVLSYYMIREDYIKFIEENE